MQVTIDHLTGSRRGRKDSFERESVLIGRGGQNDVSLDPFLDPTVSTQHAEIRFEHEGFVLYDMGSLNGTYLNGTGIRRAELKDGDEISLGQEGPKLVFRFRLDGTSPQGISFGRALRRMQPRRGPATSMEMEMPRLDETIVKGNVWVYLAGVVLLTMIGILIWKSMT